MQYPFLHSALSCVRNPYQKSATTVAPGVLATGLLDFPRSYGRLRLVIVMACMLLLIPAIGGAATVLTSGDDLAYRIENLDVGGTLYNVNFVWETAENIYGSPPNPVFDFPGDSSAADARSAVLGALNDYNAALGAGQTLVDLVGPQNRSQESTFFRIGYVSESSGTTIRNLRGSYQENPFQLWEEDVGTAIVAYNAVESWADFTVVPVPAAVWLFGSGLLGLIAVARRKKTA